MSFHVNTIILYLLTVEANSRRNVWSDLLLLVELVVF